MMLTQTTGENGKLFEFSSITETLIETAEIG